ncbi:DNA cytosine methyltransferase [Cardiobacteriaceae bacterium TAE3-ERU3]|nr:DNA cytosine methyltransferase [Cardiobacteriaceae bacterium TAE3-ERU3]
MALKAVDLFSGCGGLSEGLKQAGFQVIGAVENDPKVMSTYRLNHPATYLFDSDIREISGDNILKKCQLERGELDLLSGCPPCQGFSSLTKKYNDGDARNSLINEVARLVEELLPKTIMIENVPGMKSRGKLFLDSFLRNLDRLGYQYSYRILQVADYGVPQSRKRFVLLASRIGEISIPESTHSREGKEKQKWRTVSHAFRGLDAPISLSYAQNNGGVQKYNWNVTRDIEQINIDRLKYIPEGGDRYYIPDELRPPCHKGNNRGFGNVYGRMDWVQPSPTITGGCTVLSKGRFGHPTENRTISVREAARLQTFPDNYKFDSNFIDAVCQMIGNALPVEFARVISSESARICLRYSIENG